MEDSRPQAILKFHRLSSLDYRVRHKLPVIHCFSILSIFALFKALFKQILQIMLFLSFKEKKIKLL